MAKDYSPIVPLSKAINSEKEIPYKEFLSRYQNELTSVNTFNSIMHCKRLKQYQNEIFDEEYISELQSYMISWYFRLKKEYPKLDIKLPGRIKSFESFDRKVVSKINSDVFSVDKIHDTLAFRFIIGGNCYSHKQQIDLCYEIMNTLIYNTTIDFHTNYTPGIADPLTNLMDLNNTDVTDIFIPAKSKISPELQNLVKDYILNPKQNKYQSLHAYFTRQPGGQDFEIQVRTYDMDITAETGDADWLNYKKNKYQNISKVDRERINLEKYKYKDGKLVYDHCGFSKHRQILFLEGSI